MDLRSAVLVVALVPLLSYAQKGERPPRPDSASNARIGGWCDALTGEKKEQCLRDERRRQKDEASKAPTLRGKCDALIGPDKERCLRDGGSIEVKAAEH